MEPDRRDQEAGALAPARKQSFGWLPERLQRWGMNRAASMRKRLMSGVIGLALVGFLSVKLPLYLSAVIERGLDEAGVDVSIRDWSVDPLHLALSAEGVEIRAHGPFQRAQVLEVDAIELRYGLWNALRGRVGSIRSVSLKRPRIYLERRLTGEWNWQRVIDTRMVAEALQGMASDTRGERSGRGDVGSAAAPPAAQRDAAPRRFEIASLELLDLNLTWVELIGGRSGGGLVERAMAELHVDDVRVTVDSLAGLLTVPADPSSRFTLEGRVNDGVVALRGEMRPFVWGRARDDAKKRELEPASAVVWQPKLALELYLENIPASVLSRFMPDGMLLPKAGSIFGTIPFWTEARDDGSVRLRCEGKSRMAGVRYEPSASLDPERRRLVSASLAGFQADDTLPVDCDGDLSDPGYRFVQTMIVKTTAKALGKAPGEVQALAYEDHKRYDAKVQPSPAVQRALNQVEKAAQTMEEVGKTGRRLERALRGLPAPRGLPIPPRFPGFP